MPQERIDRLTIPERINFLLTNRIPRRWATLLMGWFGKIENRIVRGVSMAVWKLFVDDLRLHEAKKSRFDSLNDCFTRELKEGARPIDQDPDHLVSPCDAQVGACGQLKGVEAIQAKGFPYTLDDLLGDKGLVERNRDGMFVTLRLKSSMYHRFHAPESCRLREINYISGDTWNVNPIALKKVERLFCKNERAVLDLELDRSGQHLTLVPVAAILVASMKFNCLDHPLDLRYKGQNRIPCDSRFERGQEIGYFQAGSTIIVFAPKGFQLCEGIRNGHVIRMGEPLLEYPVQEEAPRSVAGVSKNLNVNQSTLTTTT